MGLARRSKSDDVANIFSFARDDEFIFWIGYVHPHGMLLISKDFMRVDVTIRNGLGFTSLHTYIGLVLMQGVWWMILMADGLLRKPNIGVSTIIFNKGFLIWDKVNFLELINSKSVLIWQNTTVDKTVVVAKPMDIFFI